MIDERIRVLHIITGLGLGGTEALLHRLLATMGSSRVSHAVVSMTDAGVLGAEIASLGVPVEPLGIRGPVSWLRSAARTAAKIRRERPHVVQTWLHDADLFGAAAVRLAGEVPLVWSLQCAELRPGEASARNLAVVRMLGLLSRMPDTVLSVSEAGRLAHERVGYRPKRWLIIPNGVDDRAYRPDEDARRRVRSELGFEAEATIIGMVGRYHPMKGQTLFVEGAAELTKRRPDVRFVMAGSNVDERNPALTDQIARLVLRGIVRPVGIWPDMPAFLNALDVMTVPSTSEGFPTVLAEAMATGVPCVATDVGDCRVVIADTGRIAAPRTSAALANAWGELLELPPAERQALGSRARQRVLEHYTLERVTAEYCRMYEELAERSAAVA